MKAQRGVFLLEALVAILIFSLGVLGMVAMGAASVSAQSDAQYRTEAANFASDIAGEIALRVDRTSPATIQTTLAPFAHQATGAGCQFSGAASVNPTVTDWVARVNAVRTGLPSAGTNQQIVVNSSAAGFNRVTITLCWQAPADRVQRHHTLTTFVN